MKTINDWILEGMQKFLINKKSAGTDDGMREGDFVCEVKYMSGHLVSCQCDAWKHDEKSLTAHLKLGEENLKEHGQILFAVIKEDGKNKFFCNAVHSVESERDAKTGMQIVTFRFTKGAYLLKESSQGFLVNKKAADSGDDRSLTFTIFDDKVSSECKCASYEIWKSNGMYSCDITFGMSEEELRRIAIGNKVRSRRAGFVIYDGDRLVVDTHILTACECIESSSDRCVMTFFSSKITEYR